MTDRSEPGEPSTARLYRAALGEASAGYYLPLFARFDTQGVAGPVWNSAAAVLHLGWLLHHRLWMPLAGCSALAATLALVVAGLWFFAPGWPMGVKLGGSLSLLVVAGLVPGLWGSAWLHARLRQRVIKAVELAPTVDAACEALGADARDRQRRNTWGLAGLLSIGALSVLLWKTVPWHSLVGGAGDSVAVSTVASSADGLANPLPAAPVLAQAGGEPSMAGAAQSSSPTSDEMNEAKAAVDGLSEPASVLVPATAAGQAALQDMVPDAKQEGPQRRSVGENAAAQEQPPKPAEAAVRAVAPPAKKAVAPVSKPPMPEAKAPLATHAELADPVDAEVAEPVTDADKPVVSAAASGGPAEIQPRVQGYGVAVGMFAVTANADRVAATLSGAGLPVISDSVASARGDLTRVRVGPFEKQEQAEAAAAKVKSLGLDARIYAP